MDPIQHKLIDQFIEESGNAYASYGLKRLNGLIIGLLFTAEEPLSLDEIAQRLHRSKGPVSEVARHLNSLGIIKKVQGENNRRDYYVLDDNMFLNAFKFNMLTVKKSLAMATSFLDRLQSLSPAQLKNFRSKLVEMKAFYSMMDSYFESFAKKWLETKAQLEVENRYEIEK